jgi:hypothetical protein
MAGAEDGAVGVTDAAAGATDVAAGVMDAEDMGAGSRADEALTAAADLHGVRLAVSMAAAAQASTVAVGEVSTAAVGIAVVAAIAAAGADTGNIEA